MSGAKIIDGLHEAVEMAHSSTPPSVSAREIAKKFVEDFDWNDDDNYWERVEEGIASALAPFMEQIRLQEIGMEQQAAIAKAQQELIDGHAEQIREKDREIERLKRAEHIDRASTKIVGEIAAMIPLSQTLDKTKTAGDFIDYVKGRLKAAETAEAQRDKAVSALKAILVQSNGPNCAAIAHEALSEIETKEAAE